MKTKADNVDEEFKSLVHDNMSTNEIAILGNVVLRHKLSKIKNRWYEWKRKVFKS